MIGSVPESRCRSQPRDPNSSFTPSMSSTPVTRSPQSEGGGADLRFSRKARSTGIGRWRSRRPYASAPYTASCRATMVSSVPPECAIASKTRSAERTPSRSGRWNATPRPPDSSPPIATSPESIFAAMCLKPTGVTWSGTPRREATRSRSSDVEKVFAMPPRMRPRTVRLSARSASTRCGVTNRPPESSTPSRSPSPSLARTTSKRSEARAICAAARFSGIGSGLTPPKSGSRFARSDTTVVGWPVPTMVSSSVPAAPWIASKRTLMPAPRIASRSTRPASASRYGDARSSVSTAPPAYLGTGRSRARAMASHVAGVALPPNEDFTFTPFQSGGLCDAVMARPALRPCEATCHEAQGVGTGRSDRRTRKPCEARNAALSAASSGERKRVSNTTGSVHGSPGSRFVSSIVHAAAAVTTRRTLSNVRSRAIRPRQPSVPKTMGARSMGQPIVGERTGTVQRAPGGCGRSLCCAFVGGEPTPASSARLDLASQAPGAPLPVTGTRIGAGVRQRSQRAHTVSDFPRSAPRRHPADEAPGARVPRLGRLPSGRDHRLAGWLLGPAIQESDDDGDAPGPHRGQAPGLGRAHLSRGPAGGRCVGRMHHHRARVRGDGPALDRREPRPDDRRLEARKMEDGQPDRRDLAHDHGREARRHRPLAKDGPGGSLRDDRDGAHLGNRLLPQIPQAPARERARGRVRAGRGTGGASAPRTRSAPSKDRPVDRPARFFELQLVARSRRPVARLFGPCLLYTSP